MRTRIALVVLAVAAAAPAVAIIDGHSIVSNCGEGGNWVEVTFDGEGLVSLDQIIWDFTGTSVWIDPDGIAMCPTINDGVVSATLFIDGPDGEPSQVFGMDFAGFDDGDLYRFTCDLDLGGSGSPFTQHYMGGTVTAIFSDGTQLTAAFDTPYDDPNGALADFSQPDTGPNLTFVDRTGWYAPVVPRGDDTAEWTSVPAPTALVGDAEETWFSAVCYNDGDQMAGTSVMIVQVDGETVCTHNLWTINPGAYNGWTDDGPHMVRGGRHTVSAICDATDNVDEIDEYDNDHVRQWIWEPVTIPMQQVVTRAAPPLYDAGQWETVPWWNCDGLRIEPVEDRPWNVIWMQPVSDEPVSYTLELHPVATGPEDGFGFSYAATFAEPDGLLDAILINALNHSDPAYDIGISNFDRDSGTVDYEIDHLGSSPYPFDFGVFPTSPYFVERAMSFDLSVSSGELGPASLVAVTDPADGPVNFGWLAPDFEAGTLEDLRDVTATNDSGWLVLNLDLQDTGHHGFVGWGNPFEHPGSLAVRVGLFHARPDLQPVTLSGWHAPVVPQPTDDSSLFSCPEPDTLHGNGPFTFMNMACSNGGSADADTVSFALRLDGDTLLGIRNVATPLAPGLPRTVLNLDNFQTDQPWIVPGGRHTLSYELDYLDDLAELLEINNLSGRQYCWSPQVMPTAGVITRESVPPRQGGHEDCEPSVELYDNCDGLRIVDVDMGAAGMWQALAVMPATGTRDVDLELHAPLMGATEGFGPEQLGSSSAGPGEIDYVIVNRRSAGLPYDVGVYDGANNAQQGYTAENVLSVYMGYPYGGEQGPFTILGDRMMKMHDMFLPAGHIVVRVDDLGGGVDWGMSFHLPWETYMGKTTTEPELIVDDAGAGGSESIHMIVHYSGYYCLAVWKSHVGDLPTTAPYRLWVTHDATDAPDVTPTATRLVSAAPNPFNPRTVIAYELAEDAPCELVIHDLQGRAVRTLVRGERPAGRHDEVFDGCDDRGRRLASGVYLARLTAGDVRDLVKLTLVK